MKKIGRILWWSKKDNNGIIIDSKDNEYYFDISVLTNEVSNGQRVVFEKNTNITDCLCAKNVEIPLKEVI